MDDLPGKGVFFHFRFKFLAITSIAFLIFIILTGANDFKTFAQSPAFHLVGPFLAVAGCLFLVFRRFPLKCPHCFRLNRTKKDWTCCHCRRRQGNERYLNEKCIHCGQIQPVSVCDHCKRAFRL